MCAFLHESAYFDIKSKLKPYCTYEGTHRHIQIRTQKHKQAHLSLHTYIHTCTCIIPIINSSTSTTCNSVTKVTASKREELNLKYKIGRNVVMVMASVYLINLCETDKRPSVAWFIYWLYPISSNTPYSIGQR